MRITGPSSHVAEAPWNDLAHVQVHTGQGVAPGPPEVVDGFTLPRGPGRGVEGCAESPRLRAESALSARHPRDPGHAGSEGVR